MKYFIALLIVIICPLVVAEQKLDIVQIMGQFIQAEYAAGKCAKPDQDTLLRFNSNFKIVSTRANEELKKRNPDHSDQQIADSLKQGTNSAEKAIDDVISN